MFKSWEEMTPLEQAQSTYSDMFKDAYGFRPRYEDSGWTLEDYDRMFEVLRVAINDKMEFEHQQQQEAIKKFEQHVTNTICMGARDRETALRWIMDASSADGDWEYFCYLNDLPYGYFKKEMGDE